ncbi:major capsid protein [Halococcus saccharolyticus]|nr:major capsid protein [Halococcus saccharolyticus]
MSGAMVNGEMNSTSDGSISGGVVRNGDIDIPRHAAAQIADARAGRNNARQNAIQEGALPEDAFADMDNAMYGPFRQMTKLWSYCRRKNLTREFDIRSQLISWNIRDDAGRSTVDMDFNTESSNLSLEFGKDAAAMPLIQVDYKTGFRERPSPDAPMGSQVDVDEEKAGAGGRIIAETAEQIISGNPGGTSPADHISVDWRGTSFGVSSLTDAERVNTTTFDAAWDTDLAQIRKSFKNLRAILKNDNNVKAGDVGYDVFLGEDYYDLLDEPDPSGNGNMLVRDRVEELSNINEIEELDFFPSDGMLMLRPTQDVFELGVAQNPQNTQWGDHAYTDEFKAHAALSPMPKVTMQGQSGIVYATAP